MKKVLFVAFALSLVISSCVKEPEPFMCSPDPRAPFLGGYAMTDSVFFLGALDEIKTYELTIEVDSMGGDTVILSNLFGDDFGFDPFAVLIDGNFVIPPQPSGMTNVSGLGSISNNVIRYSAEFEDGGFSFSGIGVKN